MTDLPVDPLSFLLKESKFLLSGPIGALELVTKPSDTGNAKGVGLFCHPNPQQGGDLHNKVVTTVCKAFNHMGLHSVKFNFRGVGFSEGQYGNVVGEIDDLLAVLKWVNRVCPGMPICLGGISFGSYVATKVSFDWANIYNIQLLLSVAPTVDRRDYAPFNTMPCPWIIIQGEDDEVVASRIVYDWYDTLILNILENQKNHLNVLPKLIKIPNAGHFFNGQLTILRNVIESILQSDWGDK